jgi:ribosomal protein S27AE
METRTLGGHLGRDVDIDVCVPCQSIWFDGKESLQLAPGATLALFRLIGENVSRPSPQDGDIVKCPRCHGQLRRTKDMQRNTRFEYFRCPNNHGRLSTFFEFLKEKDFIKPLNAQQVAELRKNLQSINCSNCGAPVDLAQHTDCKHCGSALSMLDFHQAEKLVEQLRAADVAKPIDPALPLALAKARREAEHAFKGLPHEESWDRDLSSLGVVGAGLSELIRLLKQ